MEQAKLSRLTGLLPHPSKSRVALSVTVLPSIILFLWAFYFLSKSDAFTSSAISKTLPPVSNLLEVANDASFTPPQKVIRLKESTWRSASVGPDERFFTFTPHSGLHNQRIALQNAAVVAKALKRTLIVPPLILGQGIGWHPRPKLQNHLDQAERANITLCRKIRPNSRRIIKCGQNWETIFASWSWLIDAPALSSLLPIFDRPTFHHSFYLDTLGISDSEIFQVPDPARRTYRLYDNSSEPSIPTGVNDGSGYVNRMNFEELRGMEKFRVIEFGSLFGSARLELELEENKRVHALVEKSMRFEQVALQRVSEAVARRMGGRDAYIGVHLRIGGGERSALFHVGARGRIAGIFRTLCEQLHMSDSQITDLLLQNRDHEDRPSYVPSTLTLASASTAFRPSPLLRCPYELYPSTSSLAPLNTPIYVATDALDPRIDPLLMIFRNTFPCLFFWDDFRLARRGEEYFRQEQVEEVDFLMDEIVDETGERLGEHLGPLAEAETVAKGKFVVGTPGSTFSLFARTTLYDAYHSDRTNDDFPP